MQSTLIFSKDRFPSSNTDEAPSLAAENRKSDQTKLHLATDFADTSDGAVHSYRGKEEQIFFTVDIFRVFKKQNLFLTLFNSMSSLDFFISLLIAFFY